MSVRGVGLHTGVPVEVILRREGGPVRFRQGGESARIDQLRVVSTTRATTVEACSGSLRLSTVEHMLAALAGLGVYSGIVVEVSGPEMPLLDGGASVWCERIAELRLAPEKPKVQIARRAEFVSAGGSRYEFAPGPAVDVDVRLTLDDDRIAPCASWTGDRVDFRSRIAPARTFALAADLENLARLALVRHVERASVVVIAPDAVYCTGGFLPDEPARHKLLDLVGDMYLHGGPPLGRVHAERPGHTANAQALQWATAEGVFVPATNALLS